MRTDSGTNHVDAAMSTPFAASNQAVSADPTGAGWLPACYLGRLSPDRFRAHYRAVGSVEYDAAPVVRGGLTTRMQPGPGERPPALCLAATFREWARSCLLRRVNSGVPIRVSAVITLNSSCGVSRSLITLVALRLGDGREPAELGGRYRVVRAGLAVLQAVPGEENQQLPPSLRASPFRRVKPSTSRNPMIIHASLPMKSMSACKRP